MADEDKAEGTQPNIAEGTQSKEFDRDHPVFKKLTKELLATKNQLEEIAKARAEEEKSRTIRLEEEKGNYSAALAQAKAQAAAEVEALKKQQSEIMQQIERERTSNKLLTAGVPTTKVAAFLASEYYSMPVEDRPALDEWIASAKDNEEFSHFFSKSAAHTQNPADRSGSSVAKQGGELQKAKEILTAKPGTYSTADVIAATKWRSAYYGTHGKNPW